MSECLGTMDVQSLGQVWKDVKVSECLATMDVQSLGQVWKDV